MAVSYTHLDVYKRQVQHTTENASDLLIKTCLSRSSHTLDEMIDPVSYTHLDVYKRQVSGLWLPWVISGKHALRRTESQRENETRGRKKCCVCACVPGSVSR